jgi:hypothetical protein
MNNKRDYRELTALIGNVEDIQKQLTSSLNEIEYKYVKPLMEKPKTVDTYDELIDLFLNGLKGEAVSLLRYELFKHILELENELVSKNLIKPKFNVIGEDTNDKN